MGLDGGTVVTRSDVLRGQSWRVAQNDTSRSTRGGNVTKVPTESVERSVERATAWSTCALSSQPLRPPIVACGLGRLYNKEAALQFLACRKGLVSEPEALLSYANQLRVAAGALDHITSLKDLLEVQLTPAAQAAAPVPGPSDGAGPSAAAAAATSGAATSSFVCPITLLPCERHPCSALRPCGHVLSDRALRNLALPPPGGAAGGAAAAPTGTAAAAAAAAGGSGERCCPVCGAAFTATLPVHGSPEQLEALREGLRAAAAARAARQAAAGRDAGGGGGKKRKASAAAAAGGGAGAEPPRSRCHTAAARTDGVEAPGVQAAAPQRPGRGPG